MRKPDEKRRMNQLWMAAVAAFCMGATAFADAWDTVHLRGRTLEDKVFYAPDEKMSFELKLTDAGQVTNREYFIKWTRTGDDGKREEGQAPAFADSPLVVETTLSTPGFVRIYAKIVGKDGKPHKNRYGTIDFDGGAGVQPEKLQGVPEPADFDAFWAKQKARLAAMPMTVVRKEIPCKKGRVYAVEISCPSVRPVTGYLRMPADASAEKRYPCHLETHGYSYDPRHPHWPPQEVEDGKITLNINAHGMRLPVFGGDEAYYRALEWEISSGRVGYAFDSNQNKDPEIAYFNGMALRVMRALEYLKSLPEWNGKDLIAQGGSQGGMQTIWAAALDPQVTRAEATVPWCCDIGGTEFGRNRGDEYIGWVPALGYYDPVNMARRISKTCQTVIPRAGLGDYVCPPSGVAILYNNIPGPKKITWVQGSTHGWAPPQPNQTYTYSANGAE